MEVLLMKGTPMNAVHREANELALYNSAVVLSAAEKKSTALIQCKKGAYTYVKR